MDRTPAALPESVYRELFIRSPDAIAIIDPDTGHLLVSSPAMRAMLGYDPAGSEPSDVAQICAMGPGITEAHVRAAIETGSHAFVSRWRRRDGTVIDVEIKSGTIEVGGRTLVYAIAHDVTAQNRANAALRREQQLFLGGPAVVFRWRAAPGWPVEYVSANIAQFGYTPEDFLTGRVPYASIVHPDDLARVAAEVQAHSAKGGTSFSQEYRLRRADGSWAHLIDQTVVVRNERGTPTHFEGYVIDDTQRREAQQALRESQRRLSLLVRRAPVGVIVWNPDFTIREWNPEAAAIFGYTEAQAIGMPGPQLVPPKLRAAIREVFERLLRGAGGEHSINENLTRDGRTVLCDWHNATLVADDGSVIGAASMVKDVTEETQARSELERTEAELRLITDGMPAMIASIDAEGRYRWVNKPYAEWLGRPRSEIIGHRRAEFVPAEFESALRERIEQAMSGREVTFSNTTTVGGTERSFDVTFMPRRIDGQVLGYYVLALDITARRAVELELERHRKHLEALVEERTAELEAQSERLRQAQHLASMGTLAAGVGHDVNNMLLPMRCALDGLAAADAVGGVGGRASHLAALQRSLDFLSHLAGGLLQLASAPDDAARGHPRTNLAQWWAKDGAMLAGAARGAIVKIDLPGRLPDIAIAADHLTRAVLNLVVNAAEAVGPGGDVRVWARAEPARVGFVAVGVTDNGPGMTEDVRRRVLEPFFTTKKRTLSTGLGLSLVHAVVDAVGGTVTVESSPGHGTTVLLQIPTAGAVSPARRAGSDRPRTAVVSIADDRVAGFILALLSARSIPATRQEAALGPGESSIWITEPNPELPGHLNDPTRKTIVVGAAPPEWAALGAILIPDATDVGGIAAALR